MSFIATRAAGLERLQQFVPRAGADYAARRNIDVGPNATPAVSMLSPYLRHRLLSEHEVVTAVLGRHCYASAEKFVQEVCWRSYWKGWLQQHPQIWGRYRADRDAAIAALEQDARLLSGYAAACAGRSGIACFDAWCGELQRTGYLHNHARMWFASIWIFTLRLPWTLGADLFLRHLVDGDAASNTLSWRWVAGLQTVGKHYLARAENIARYTQNRFDPQGQLNENASPLPADAPVGLESLPALRAPDATKPCALLISDEDCDPLSLWPREVRPPFAIAAFRDGIAARTPQGLGGPARQFAGGALVDALARAGQQWPSARIAPDLAALQAWLREVPDAQLLFSEPAIGPTADALATTLARLSAQGVSLVPRRREWDAQFWPHARRGFFQLRARIPQVLGQLQIGVS